MKHLRALFAFAAAAALSTPALADDYSYIGTLDDPNQVLLFDFTVGAESNVTLRTYSYAGGTMADGTVVSSGGFDPILALFDGTGAYITQNDDGGSAHVPGDGGRYYDTYLNRLLAPGTYTVSVMAYSNFANGPNLSDGFENDGSFNGRTNAWAFDILNVSQATQVGGAVPEPATWAMMLFGFGATGVALRRQRRKGALAIA